MADLIKWIWARFPRWRVVATVAHADEVPDDIPKQGAVLVGSMSKPKWLAFDCPCNTGHRMMVTLDPKHRPHWTVYDAQKLTVWPSFDYEAPGRKCHYVLRSGRVIWIPAGRWYTWAREGAHGRRST